MFNNFFKKLKLNLKKSGTGSSTYGQMPSILQVHIILNLDFYTQPSYQMTCEENELFSNICTCSGNYQKMCTHKIRE